MSESLIELRHLRAANLRSMMLLLELGVGLRVEAPVEQVAVDTQPSKESPC